MGATYSGAEGVPHQDLVVSPAHAMLLDGYLVPAFQLLNGVTIVREPAAGQVEYLHIERKTTASSGPTAPPPKPS